MLPGPAVSMIEPVNEKDALAPANREIVTAAFAAWMDGSGSVTGTFADDMTWEITGHSADSRKYASARQFVDEVLSPFGARFSAEDPFRPVAIPGSRPALESATVNTPGAAPRCRCTPLAFSRTGTDHVLLAARGRG